jgi:hypothetical protein
VIRLACIIAVIVALSCFGHAQAVGCGATAGGVETDESDCGRVGDPYGGAGAPPGQQAISACGALSTAGGSNFVLTQNIGSDATVNCITTSFPSALINLDLGGFTVTGGVDISTTNQHLNVVMNGTINCTSGTLLACLMFLDTGSIHHLTIQQTAANPASCLGLTNIKIVGNEPVGNPLLDLRIHHVTSTIPECDGANRTANVSDAGVSGCSPGTVYGSTCNPTTRSVSIEFDHNSMTCSNNASSCQGVDFFSSSKPYAHNNLFTLPAVCDAGHSCQDSSRGIVDENGPPGEHAFNTFITRNNRGIRQRSGGIDSLPGTMLIHDNYFKNIQTTGRAAAIHIGENDNDINDTVVDAYSNAFQLASGGQGAVSSAAKNFTLENNIVTCTPDCTSVGFFALTQVPSLSYGATGTQFLVKNNNVAALTAAGKSAGMACASPGNALYTCAADANATLTTTLSICNSGTAVGNGTILIVNCNPVAPNTSMFARMMKDLNDPQPRPHTLRFSKPTFSFFRPHNEGGEIKRN